MEHEGLGACAMTSTENKGLGDKLLNFLVALILHERGGNPGHDVHKYVNNACLAQYCREMFRSENWNWA